MRISDWSSDVCSSDLCADIGAPTSSCWAQAHASKLTRRPRRSTPGDAEIGPEAQALRSGLGVDRGAGLQLVLRSALGDADHGGAQQAAVLDVTGGEDRKSTRLNSSH